MITSNIKRHHIVWSWSHLEAHSSNLHYHNHHYHRHHLHGLNLNRLHCIALIRNWRPPLPQLNSMNYLNDWPSLLRCIISSYTIKLPRLEVLSWSYGRYDFFSRLGGLSIFLNQLIKIFLVESTELSIKNRCIHAGCTSPHTNLYKELPKPHRSNEIFKLKILIAKLSVQNDFLYCKKSLQIIFNWIFQSCSQ